MARQQFNFDTQGNWESGEFSGTNAIDPAGSLTLGIATTQIATFVDEGGLAVYCRCYEGSGATAANLGSAGDASLAAHAWVERDDGRSWLSGGTATITYHASMRVANASSKYKDGSGGIRIKLANVSSQVLMSRTNLFALGIDGNDKPYITWKYGGNQTVTSKDALEDGEEYAVSFSCNQGTVMLYVNGVLKGKMYYENVSTVPVTNLVVGCTGLWTDFYYFGDGTSGQVFDRQATGGWWKKVIDLGEVQKLHHLYVNCAKIEAEHSISARVSFGSAESEIQFEQNDNSILWTIKDGESWNEPLETGLRYGQYVEIKIQLGTINWSRDLPLVFEIEADFMPLAGGLLPAIDEDDEDTYVSLEDDTPEITDPEDLEGALAAIRALKAVTRENRRRTNTNRGSIGGNYNRIQRLEEDVELTSVLAGIPGLFDEFQTATANALVNLKASEAREWLAGMIFINENGIETLRTIMDDHILATYADDVHALSSAGIPALISTHAARITGIHGAGAGDILTELMLATGEPLDVWMAANIYLHQIVSTAHQDAPNLISAHESNSASHTGAGEAIPAEIADHNAKGTAHGGVETDFLGHKDSATGVHSVGGYAIAHVNDIATHAGLATGVHGSGADVLATDDDISNHALIIGGVHGVSGAGNTIAGTDDIDTEIAAHESRCINYAT